MSDSASDEIDAVTSFAGKLVFLVYDSRSGSTLFSHELAKSFPQLVASPEFRINALLSLTSSVLNELEADKMVAHLTHNGSLENLQLLDSALIKTVGALSQPRTHEQILRAILALYVQQQEHADAHVFVIKKGTHLRVWQRVCECFEDVRFLHIFRDPRAVINSKLKTVRPYYPRERMAWGGAFLAALQWREYSRQMRLASDKAQVLDVVYEDLLSDPEQVLKKVGAFLGVQYVPAADLEYTIPDAEKAIHTKVAGGMDSSRAQAWKTEMSPRDVVIVETIARHEMHARGYSRNASHSVFTKTSALLVGVFESAIRFVFHYPYNWLVERRRR